MKYGYLNVGVVEEGPPHLVGSTVFCLYPHQTAYTVPEDAVITVPASVPPERAVLAGLVETAVNALWDAAPLVGDRVAVVGGGALGLCVARLLARIPEVRVTVVDVDEGRAPLVRRLGAAFATPEAAPPDQDLMVHASATSAGLQLCVDLVAVEGTVIDLSWYGTDETTLRLGGAFHSRRVTVRSSQVGMVAPARRLRRSPRQRLELALDLLRDPAFDGLLTGCSPFEDLPEVMSQLADGRLPGLCHSITYEGTAPCSA